MTRPYVAHAVQVVSEFIFDPCHPHLIIVHHIIRYLRRTTDKGLFYSSQCSLQLAAYANAVCAGWPDTRRSTTGWCLFLGSSLISWKSKTRKTVSKSPCEAEYHAMSFATSEIVWL